jgi:hypothetical protein
MHDRENASVALASASASTYDGNREDARGAASGPRGAYLATVVRPSSEAAPRGRAPLSLRYSLVILAQPTEVPRMLDLKRSKTDMR